MNTDTGELYESLEAAKAAGVKERALVQLQGERAAISKVSELTRQAARAAGRISDAEAKAIRESNRKFLTKNQAKRARQKERGKR